MLGADRILALDIGAATVKLAEFEASKTHALRLLSFNHADLGLDPEKEENRKPLTISTIRNLLREKNIRTRRVIFSVSGQSVFTRFVKLPPVDESKVVQIIRYEAQQNVPFPIEEVIWDYQLVGSTQEGEIEVVLLAIKSDIIEELNDAVESAGLRTRMVDVAPMALYNAVRYNYGELDGCTMVVDIGARTTNLLFIERNRLFSRAIPIAGNAITQNIASEFGISFLEAEQLKKQKGFVALGGAYEEPADEQQARVAKIVRHVMTRLHAEIARSVNFYRSQQGGGAPVRLFLSGGSSILPYTDRFFKEKVQLPVEYFNPFRNVELDVSVSREELARCAHFFGEVVGLGLRHHIECPVEVNLLPRSVQRRQQLEGKRPFFAGVAVCLLLIPLCWLVYTRKMVNLKQKQLDQLTVQVQNLRQLAAAVDREKAQLKQIESRSQELLQLIERRDFWLGLLQDLNQRLVPGLWIVSLTPETPGKETERPAPTGRGARQPVGRIRDFADAEFGFEPSAPTGPASTAPREITGFRIVGGGDHSFDDPGQDVKLVADFAANLRQSPYLDPDGVEIEVLPNPTAKDPRFSFVLRVRLAKPLSF